MSKHISRIGLLVLILSSLCMASDWPQYLGPGRNAVSTETGIKRTWPEGGPEVLWTVPLGEGYGGAAVSEGKVYVLDRDGDEGDILRSLDLMTGKEEWRFAYDSPGKLSRGEITRPFRQSTGISSMLADLLAISTVLISAPINQSGQ